MRRTGRYATIFGMTMVVPFAAVPVSSALAAIQIFAAMLRTPAAAAEPVSQELFTVNNLWIMIAAALVSSGGSGSSANNADAHPKMAAQRVREHLI